MQTSHLVEPALSQHAVESADAGAQTIESRRPVKDFHSRDRHPPRTAASRVRRGNISRSGATIGQSYTISRGSDRLNQTMPSRMVGATGAWNSQAGQAVKAQRQPQQQLGAADTNKIFQTFCGERNISVLPLVKIQRDTFVTHYDRQELGAVEAAEEKARHRMNEAMQYEYTGRFTYLCRELRVMHEEVLESRSYQVAEEASVRKKLEASEENRRIPISQEKCRVEYSYKYLEQILKRGAILEDDMKRERKLTGRDEDQKRKYIVTEFRVMRGALQKKEANNIHHMNIQASSFAKAAANFHLVCHEEQQSRHISTFPHFTSHTPTPSRGGGGATTSRSGLLLTPGRASTALGTSTDPFPSAHHGGDLDASEIHPTFGVMRSFDQSDIDSNHRWMPSHDVVSTVISPLSPLAGTKKHTLHKTQFIQEVLASRPALYTKKMFAGSPGPSSPGPGGGTGRKKKKKSGDAPTRSSITTGGGKRRQSSVSGNRKSTSQHSDLDTHSLAPTIPFWLYKAQTMEDFQRALYDRLDTSGTEYLPVPLTAVPLLQQLSLIDDPWQRLHLLFEELRLREEEEKEVNSRRRYSDGDDDGDNFDDPTATVKEEHRRVQKETEVLELNLAAAALLCKLEDPRRSIMIISECLLKLESLAQQPPSLVGANSSGGGRRITATEQQEEIDRSRQQEGALFKLSCICIHNAAMSLAMLPEENNGGSSTNSGGGSGGASSPDRRKSRAGGSVISTNRRSSRWQGLDDARIKPVSLAKMAAEIAAISFGPFAAFSKHLEQEGVANVLQMDVLPQSILPPRTSSPSSRAREMSSTSPTFPVGGDTSGYRRVITPATPSQQW